MSTVKTPGGVVLVLPAAVWIEERYEAGWWYLMARTQGGGVYEAEHIGHDPGAHDRAVQLLADVQAMLDAALNVPPAPPPGAGGRCLACVIMNRAPSACLARFEVPSPKDCGAVDRS